MVINPGGGYGVPTVVVAVCTDSGGYGVYRQWWLRRQWLPAVVQSVVTGCGTVSGTVSGTVLDVPVCTVTPCFLSTRLAPFYRNLAFLSVSVCH